MSESVDCVVAGAGVVGLAVARALALQGREVLVLEAEADIGTGTSSRSSGATMITRQPCQPVGVALVSRYSVLNSAASSTVMWWRAPGAIHTARVGGTM